jgi:hypothetical protein
MVCVAQSEKKNLNRQDARNAKIFLFGWSDDLRCAIRKKKFEPPRRQGRQGFYKGRMVIGVAQSEKKNLNRQDARNARIFYKGRMMIGVAQSEKKNLNRQDARDAKIFYSGGVMICVVQSENMIRRTVSKIRLNLILGAPGVLAVQFSFNRADVTQRPVCRHARLSGKEPCDR